MRSSIVFALLLSCANARTRADAPIAIRQAPDPDRHCTLAPWTGACEPRLVARGDLYPVFADSEGVVLRAFESTYVPWDRKPVRVPFTISSAARLDPDRLVVSALGLVLIDVATHKWRLLDGDDSAYKPWEAHVVGVVDDRVYYLRRWCCGHGGALMSIGMWIDDRPLDLGGHVEDAIVHDREVVSIESTKRFWFTLRTHDRTGTPRAVTVHVPDCEPSTFLRREVTLHSDGRDVFVAAETWEQTRKCLYRIHDGEASLVASFGGLADVAVGPGLAATFDGGEIILTDTATGTELARHARAIAFGLTVTAERILWVDADGLWAVAR